MFWILIFVVEESLLVVFSQELKSPFATAKLSGVYDCQSRRRCGEGVNDSISFRKGSLHPPPTACCGFLARSSTVDSYCSAYGRHLMKRMKLRLELSTRDSHDFPR